MQNPVRRTTGMQAYKTATKIEREGELRLRLLDLPFHAGDEVEVILLRREPELPQKNPYPLRGLPIHYDDPTEPVAEDDWDVLSNNFVHSHMA
jgi:hypothetical protein